MQSKNHLCELHWHSCDVCRFRTSAAVCLLFLSGPGSKKHIPTDAMFQAQTYGHPRGQHSKLSWLLQPQYAQPKALPPEREALPWPPTQTPPNTSAQCRANQSQVTTKSIRFYQEVKTKQLVGTQHVTDHCIFHSHPAPEDRVWFNKQTHAFRKF